MAKAAVLILALGIAVFLYGCTQHEGLQKPVINQSDALRPLIKLKISAKEKEEAKKAGWETISGLFLMDNGKPVSAAVACRYWVETDTLYFSPLVPLGNGLSFEVLVYDKKDTLHAQFTTPPPAENEAAMVSAAYPLTDSVPCNILMFHVLFSAPMTEDVKAYKNVKLLDENGRERSMVWREKSNWDKDGRHLVLMVHPGRVKRGIIYAEEDGPLMLPGKKYTLVITTALNDRNGKPLLKEYRREFTALPADREIPVLLKETIAIPKAGNREALVFYFSDKMDFGTMEIGAAIKDDTGNKMAGKFEPMTDRQWHFVPEKEWQSSPYTLELNDYTTDLAGNHLTRKFEEESLEGMKNKQAVTFSFRPR